MIVIDNSVLIAAFLETGRRGDAAREVMRRPDLTAPELIDVEAVHSARGLLRGGKISRPSADRFLAELPDLAIHRIPHRPLLARMWELRDNLTAYDACYVALAEDLQAPLATGDRALVSAPGLRCAFELIT